MRRGNWVLYNDVPHIVIAVLGDRVSMHEIADDGTTVMELNPALGRVVDKNVVAPMWDVQMCPTSRIPAARRPVKAKS